MFFNQETQSGPLEPVKLKNGSIHQAALVVSVMTNIKSLTSGENPGALYELFLKCKDSEYEVSENNRGILEGLALMKSGSVSEDVQDVVLSALQLEGLNMR